MAATAKYRAQGCNCAETIVKTFNEEYGMNLPPRAATAFGGGMSSGDTCGAVAAAVMALGMLYGRDDGSAPNTVRVPAKRLVEQMREHFGALDCRDLKRAGVTCDELIEYAYQTMKECAKEAEEA